MKVADARKLKSGDTVKTDKGKFIEVKQPLSLSKVTKVFKNNKGIEYVWVGTNAGVWPSNRLRRI